MTVVGTDGKARCEWASTAPEFVPYHDREWGFPVDDDTRLFEKLSLEAFQSGLSWRTILNKRENFRAAFHGFDIPTVAQFGASDVERLLQDAGIIRHRGKISAVINNAQQVPETIGDKSLASYIWAFEPVTRTPRGSALVATTPESETLAKALKANGWKFVGPTTVYAFMQAMGLVNDHELGCFVHAKVEQARKSFQPPRS